jgi:FMN phosphatase YigB (HAD superfamily)
MIKRVIFDLDDTLIPWDNSYFKDFMPVMFEYGVIDSKEDILKFVKAINDYEKFNNRYV